MILQLQKEKLCNKTQRIKKCNLKWLWKIVMPLKSGEDEALYFQFSLFYFIFGVVCVMTIIIL